MSITNNAKIPFIDEAFTEQIKDLKIFIHNNIYSNDIAINKLIEIIKKYNMSFINLEMDRQYKTITLSFENKSNSIVNVFGSEDVDMCYDVISLYLQEFFSDSYIQGLLNICENQYKYSLTDFNFLKLLFNVTRISDNMIKIFL